MTQALLNQLSDKAQGVVEGLLGSSPAMIIASLFQQKQQPVLFIDNDKEAAAYLYNDLQNLVGKTRVEFLPSSYQRSIQYGKVDRSNILLRTDILTKISSKHPPMILVSYPEGIMEKVISEEQITANTFTIRKDDKLSMDFVVELLTEYEFDRVDFVYEPGQYAVRGSLIDVFSFAGEEPFRIDFFGDEVNSLRIFDIETQLTVSNPEAITIIPNIQENLAENKRISLVDYLPKNTFYWFRDPDFAIERMNQVVKKTDLAEQETEYQFDRVEEIVETGKEWLSHLKEKTTLALQPSKLFEQKTVATFSTSIQPALRKNFDMLAEDLNAHSTDGYQNFILSDSVDQMERLKAIFADKGSKVIYTPIIKTLNEGFIDHDLQICCYTDHQIFERYHKFNIKTGFTKKDSITLAELTNLHPGDYVVHIDHGIGKFGGLHTVNMNGKKQEAIKLIYRDSDVLFVSIHSLHRISKYKGKDAEEPTVHKLGSAVWKNLKAKTKSKVKDIAKDLIKLYAERKAQRGHAFAPDSFLNQELEASFIYEDTPDQVKATKAVKNDMESTMPMDRLICGDVGFGKTEIAIRAAFKAVTDGKQVAVLVPTTILALQHYKTFANRLTDMPCSVDYLTRLRSPKEQKEIITRLKEGSLDIVIGTHKMVGKEIKFKDLGLLVIDEEQKFGVSIKEKLKQFKSNVDTLTLTATPIPRTLQFSLMGARDLSIINTPPPNRQPILTEVHTFNEEIIKEAVNYELNRNGQVFFIHNRVQNIDEVAGMIMRLCPNAKAVHAHGQLDGKELEKIMLEFIEGKYDVLVATTIIESGLDIPNANTIIINEAQNYGLSDLHQLRGRVGRSNKKAFCYLLAPPTTSLTNEARRRLTAIENFSELGSGFNIALQDLDIRGAGNLLGAEQSGFIGDLGFEAYQKILDEALLELKENDLKELYEESESQEKPIDYSALAEMRFVSDCQIDTDLELLFPDSYIENISERINLYRQLDTIETDEELESFKIRLIDRFGEIPTPTLELTEVVRLRWLAVKLGIERIYLKNNNMIVHFISDQQSLFYRSPLFQHIIQNVMQLHQHCQIQEKNNKLTLTFNQVKTVNKAYHWLKKLLDNQ